jgi:hypothetical protein
MPPARHQGQLLLLGAAPEPDATRGELFDDGEDMLRVVSESVELALERVPDPDPMTLSY